ncbi:MAG TPA: serine/threonine-protein kinase [Thermoanaerobaculia bacterium]|nr:serine/threonine-protein kinase [Thermoanaerobaculia bacterium]
MQEHQSAVTPSPDPTLTERIGTRIGSFLLTRHLASGGMSSVFEAVDERLGRTVAIKLLDHDQVSTLLRRRLLREAKLLSRLNHPNVCTLYEYLEGEHEDALVLERIEGRTLAEALAERLPKRQRLAIARETAEALAAAHSQGIVHRDLKLDNVMLTPDGRAKVLDFGVARELGELAELSATAGVLSGFDPQRTLEEVTRAGTVAGTLLAMSPEQARGEATTPASDMYSFGLLLQQLFSSRQPYPSGLLFHEAAQWVTEGRTQPAEIQDADLGALIEELKAPSPADRPPAAATVARLERIASRPVRRLRFAVATALVVCGLAAGVAYLRAVGTERNRAVAAERAAREALAAAEAARADQRKVLDFVVGLFEVSDPTSARVRAITVRELLDAAASEIATDRTLTVGVRGRLEETFGRIYRNLGLYPEARRMLEASLALRESSLGAEHPATVTSRFELATLDQLEHRPEAEAKLREVLAARERILGPDHLDVAAVLNRLAVSLGQAHRLPEARALLERALAIREQQLPEGDSVTVAMMSNLAIVFAQSGELERARELFERALTLREAILPADHPDLAVQREALAVLYAELGDPATSERLRRRALPVFEKALGPDHPTTLLSKSNLVAVLVELGRLDEAARLGPEVLAARQRVLGPDHPAVGATWGTLASLYEKQGDLARARAAVERQIAILVRAFPPDHPQILAAREQLARLERQPNLDLD